MEPERLERCPHRDPLLARGLRDLRKVPAKAKVERGVEPALEFPFRIVVKVRGSLWLVALRDPGKGPLEHQALAIGFDERGLNSRPELPDVGPSSESRSRSSSSGRVHLRVFRCSADQRLFRCGGLRGVLTLVCANPTGGPANHGQEHIQDKRRNGDIVEYCG